MYCPACGSCNAASVMMPESMLFACANCAMLAEVFYEWPEYDGCSS
jgi:hypothetical protein